MKKCSRCQELKSLDDYFKDSYRTDGLTSQCKKCRNEIKTEYRRKTPGHWMKSQHNITYRQMLDILESQDNVCALCKQTSDKWHVDHDHSCCPNRRTCGKCIRGVLCPGCNTALGFYEKIGNPQLLTEYLDSNRLGV